ncbi:MAG: hypothetical protein Q4G00_16995, partial [Clostridia bacterium]|nr:hypothetical protein [Clostridia bacterium]
HTVNYITTCACHPNTFLTNHTFWYMIIYTEFLLLIKTATEFNKKRSFLYSLNSGVEKGKYLGVE